MISVVRICTAQSNVKRMIHCQSKRSGRKEHAGEEQKDSVSVLSVEDEERTRRSGEEQLVGARNDWCV